MAFDFIPPAFDFIPRDALCRVTNFLFFFYLKIQNPFYSKKFQLEFKKNDSFLLAMLKDTLALTLADSKSALFLTYPYRYGVTYV